MGVPAGRGGATAGDCGGALDPLLAHGRIGSGLWVGPRAGTNAELDTGRAKPPGRTMACGTSSRGVGSVGWAATALGTPRCVQVAPPGCASPAAARAPTSVTPRTSTGMGGACCPTADAASEARLGHDAYLVRQLARGTGGRQLASTSGPLGR